MKIGIVQRQTLENAITVTASVTLVDIPGFSVPVVAGVRYQFFVHIPFTVAAAGGFNFRLDAPAPDNYENVQQAVNLVATPPVFFAGNVILALTDFANAAAVAGAHVVTMRGLYSPTVNGTMKIQVACDSAAGNIILTNGYFEVITF